MIPSFKVLKRNLKKDFSSLPKLRVALLGDTATQFLATAIIGMGYERGYDIDLFEAEYNQVERQFLDPSSELYAFAANYVIVFQSTHKLLSKYSTKNVEELTSFANERLEFVKLLSCSLNSRLIYLNYPEIDDSVFGSYSNIAEISFTYQVRKLNYELMNLTHQLSNLSICDIASLQNKFGRDTMFDSSVYVGTEIILSLDSIPYVASRIIDIICAYQGKLKKSLILDLDNTVWGGVIGDDGWENIQIGHGLGIGKAYTEFQQWVKKLKDRGIIIAVCSKNNEEVAKEPFEKHPDMVLRLEDIAVFISNWDNKADNIRQIQSILNIGFDSMVFLDDNPFERNMVRENIPDICVPELPEDPGDYLEYLYSLNLFETASYCKADSDRTKQYQIESKRASSQNKFTNEADFLKSLNMISVVEGFNKFNTPRVAQLSQRSNQFNLRTIRFTEAEIEKFSFDNHFQNFCFTLSDKFGENGLICVIILEKQDSKTLFINTWFMSCRVLKRGMENFSLNTIVKFALDNSFEIIVGEYIPTSKNRMVTGHYQELGFKPMNVEGKYLYSLEVESYHDRECYILSK